MIALHCLACSAGMIPSKPVLRHTALTPISLANALPKSMSAPTGFWPEVYDSNGGNEMSAQYVILPALLMSGGGVMLAACAADAAAPAAIAVASEATAMERWNVMLGLPSRVTWS